MLINDYNNKGRVIDLFHESLNKLLNIETDFINAVLVVMTAIMMLLLILV